MSSCFFLVLRLVRRKIVDYDPPVSPVASNVGKMLPVIIDFLPHEKIRLLVKDIPRIIP